MIVVLHGTLRKRFGKSFEMNSPTAADAIEGLSRQLPDFPRDLLIEVPGFETEEKLKAETDVTEIHLVPVMFGGGGKFVSIILGAALIVAGIIVSGIPGFQAVGVALISAGVSMVATGIIALFMKAPTADKSNDPAASNYLGINKNTVEIGTLIPLAWGTVKLYGHWISLQSDADKLVQGVFPATTT